MRKLILAAVLALIGLLPATGHAQQGKPPGDMFGLSSGQVIAIGVGTIGGVIVAEAVLVGTPMWIGATVGGLVGNWWYSQQAEEMRATATRRAAALADEAKLYMVGINDYAAAAVSPATPRAKLLKD